MAGFKQHLGVGQIAHAAGKHADGFQLLHLDQLVAQQLPLSDVGEDHHNPLADQLGIGDGVADLAVFCRPP